MLFTDCLEHDPDNIEKFANIIGSIQNSFLDRLDISFEKMYKLNRKLTENLQLQSIMIAMCQKIVENGNGDERCPPVRAAK